MLKTVRLAFRSLIRDHPGMPPNTPPNKDRTDHRSGVSVAEAARLLDLTPDAVRMRLKRGALDGEKRGAEWIVWLAATEQTAEHHRTTTDQPSEQTTEQHGPSWAALLAAKDAALHAQADEIAFLRGQLDHSRRELSAERERFDVIHREALGRIEALTATLVETEPPDEDDSPFYGAEKPEKPPASPETRDVAPGRADPLDVSPESNEPAPNAGRSVFEDLWRWIRGR